MSSDDDLKALAKRLKEAGDKGLQRELTKELSNAVAPLKKSIPASGRKVLPRKGGLNEDVVRKLKFGVLKRSGGIIFKVRNQYQILKMDDPGQVRHPVNNRKNKGKNAPWVTQRIKPGWVSIPWKANRANVIESAQQAVENVAKKIDKG